MNIYKKYVITFFVTILFLYLMAVGFQYSLVNANIMPAVPVSNSFSLNEKTKFLASKKIQACDILVSGSSVSLYNINSQVMQEYYANSSYLNISSWGITLGDNLKILTSFIENICKPKVVIIASFPVDFRKAVVLDQGFDEEMYINLISSAESRNNIFSVKNIYYVFTKYERVKRVTRSYAGKESLVFDSGGGVSIMEKDWKNNNPDWNINTIDKVRATREGYRAFENIVRYLNNAGIKVILVQTPIRADIYQHSKAVVIQHIEYINMLARDLPYEFYDLSMMSGISSDLYTDLNHLTGEGSVIFTKELLMNLRVSTGLLQRNKMMLTGQQ